MDPDMDATRTIEPGLLAAIKAFPTAWETRKEPVKLISIKRLNMTVS